MWPNFDGKPYTRDQLAARINSCDFSKWTRKDGSVGKPSFITLHNTSSPTIALWMSWSPQKRQDYIFNAQEYYEKMGWRGGPHFFVTPQDDICAFGFNDLLSAGTHASCFNNDSIGIEMVGEFDSEPFNSGSGATVAENAIYLLALLHLKIGLTPLPYTYGQCGLHFHVECKKDDHDCPGHLVQKPDVVTRIANKMNDLTAKPVKMAASKQVSIAAPPKSASFLLPTESVSRIGNLAAASSLAFYDWKDRGKAPIGYIKGMAAAFGGCYARLKSGDDAVLAMSTPVVSPDALDALDWYSARFTEAGFGVVTEPKDILRRLFVLLIGLGMRESSGRYCEGRDRSAQNTDADTAEAGLFQMSWNANAKVPMMQSLFDRYQDFTDILLPIFQEDVAPPSHQDLTNYGDGPGCEFQMLCKSSPAFAVDCAAVGLRVLRIHWGPINGRAAEVVPIADELLRSVQSLVDCYL